MAYVGGLGEFGLGDSRGPLGGAPVGGPTDLLPLRIVVDGRCVDRIVVVAQFEDVEV